MLILAEQGRRQRIENLAFSPNGDVLLATGTGSWLDIWRLAEKTRTSRHFETSDSAARIVHAQFIDGGNAVLAACGIKGLRIAPVSPESGFGNTTLPGKLIWLKKRPIKRSLRGLTVSADETRIISSTGCKKGLVCWLLKSGNRYRRDWFVSSGGHHKDPTFLDDGRLFVLHEYGSLVVRSAESGQKLESYSCPYSSGGTPVISPCGRWLAVIARVLLSVSERGGGYAFSKGLAIWLRHDLTREPLILSNDDRTHFTDIAFHPSGRWLAATSKDGNVKLYDTDTWKVSKTYAWNIGRLRSIAFSPDGALAAAGSDTGKIVVWDVDDF